MIGTFVWQMSFAINSVRLIELKYRCVSIQTNLIVVIITLYSVLGRKIALNLQGPYSSPLALRRLQMRHRSGRLARGVQWARAGLRPPLCCQSGWRCCFGEVCHRLSPSSLMHIISPGRSLRALVWMITTLGLWKQALYWHPFSPLYHVLSYSIQNVSLKIM